MIVSRAFKSPACAAVMATLEGKISNLGDAWDSLLLMFGEGGAGDLSKKIVDLFIVWIEKAKEYTASFQEGFKKFAISWNEAIKSSAAFRGIVEGIFQAFVVGIAITTEPLKLLYTQIKGIVLALVSLSKGDFSGAFDSIVDAQVAFVDSLKDTYKTLKDSFAAMGEVAGGKGYEKYLINLEKAKEAEGKHSEAIKKKTVVTKEELEKQKKEWEDYKKESDKIAESFFDEWERVEKINIKKSEDAKAQKLKDEKDYQEASLKQQEDFLDEAMRVEQKRIDKEAEQAKFIKDTKKQLASDAWQSTKDLIDTMFKIEQTNYDKESQNIEDIADAKANALKAQLDNDKLTVESRAQIEGQIKGIEAQKAKDLEVIEKKKKESQRKQFEVNRAIAIAEIAMNTAQAIMKTYANVGAPWVIPLIVAAGALGAVQAGIVLAQPIPAFDKGTESAPNTPFLVGEKGAEFVTKNGKTQLVTEPTVMHGMGGAKITSRIETQKILQENQKSQVWSYLNKKDGLISSQLLQEQKETNRLLKLQAQRNAKVVVNTPKNSFADMANSNVLYNLRK